MGKSTKKSASKVTEAIQIGARAIKENSTSVDEGQRCLEELDSSIAMQEVDNVLGIALMRMTYHKTYIKECSSSSMELAATVMVNGATLATLLGKWPFLPEVETKFPL
ncbi:hypothetical protein ACET3Z_005198 [Daucus carota]